MLKMELDESNGVPLYRQLKDILYSKIRASEWQKDSQIPTEEELVATFGVSRSTVRVALAELIRQDILYRKRGVGTFVTGVKAKTYSIYSRSYPEDSDDYHEVVAVNTLLPDPEMAQLLRISLDTPIFEFIRLRPMDKAGSSSLDKSYITQTRCPDLPSAPPSEPLFEWLERCYGITISDWKVFLDATTLNEEDARLVDAEPGSPALMYNRLNLDAQGTPIYFSKSYFRSDRFYLSSSSCEKGFLLKSKL